LQGRRRKAPLPHPNSGWRIHRVFCDVCDEGFPALGNGSQGRTFLPRGSKVKTLIATTAMLLMAPPAFSSAQDGDHQSRGLGYVFVGAGTHTMGLTTGFGVEGYVYKGLGMGVEVGTAGLGASANGNPNWIGLGSADASYHFFPKKIGGRRLHKFLRARRLSAVPGAPVAGKFCPWLQHRGRRRPLRVEAYWRALRRSLQRPRRPHPLGIIPQSCSVQFRCLPHRFDVQVGPSSPQGSRPEAGPRQLVGRLEPGRASPHCLAGG